MPILDRYRQQPSSSSPLRPLLLLTALLAGLVAAILSLGGDEERVEPANRPATARQAETPSQPVRVEPETPVEPQEWRELSEQEELRMLARVVDQQSLAVREQKQAYYYMLGKVDHMSPEDMEFLLDRNLGYADFANRPDIVRGSAAELAGTVVRLRRVSLRNTRSPVRVVWEGNMIDRDGRPLMFVLTDEPEAPFVPGEVTVQEPGFAVLRGVFLQNIQYQNAAGDWVAMPLLIARRLRARAAPRPADDRNTWLWMGIAVAAFVLLAVRLLQLYRRVRHGGARRSPQRPASEEPPDELPDAPADSD
jgi:hypothetical protein